MVNPTWLTEEGLITLKKQHLLPGETLEEAYHRVVNSLGYYLNKNLRESKTCNWNQDEIDNFVASKKEKWFSYLWNNWLCPATPVLSNCGTNRGLPISCNISRMDDSIDSIWTKIYEMALLSKYGAGVGITMDKIRGAGESISRGGFSDGVVPFIKAIDSSIAAVSQSGIRRGYASINLPIRHRDIEDFIELREPTGDVNRICRNLQLCVTIDDYFMEDLENGDEKARELWAKILTKRIRTGSPYIMYYHNANNARPKSMKDLNLKIDGTNICSEIQLPHYQDYTVVCCLSSKNMFKYDEWKDVPGFEENCLLFLDCVMEEYIDKASKIKGFESAVRFAQSARATGLGILGWHSYLQSKMLPFNSIPVRGLIHQIGTKMIEGKNNFNKIYGELLGSPEWCVNGERGLTSHAVAPNTTSADIGGGQSQGLEPRMANIITHETAKGTFIKKNKEFVAFLNDKYPEKNTSDFWNDLSMHKGSVQHLDFLTDYEKEVFLTAHEINQFELVKNAAYWQQFVDQGISLNLFFTNNAPAKWINKCHIEAWKLGLKSLYYIHTESVGSNFLNSTYSDCLSCEG